MRYYGDRENEEAALPQSNTDCLCKQDLPVLGAETRHHEAEADQRRACGGECLKLASVMERPCDDADDEEQERLNAADP